MDTRVAYWTENKGVLTLFNTAGQQLKIIPATQAPAYIAAYSAGHPDATDVGRSLGIAPTGTTSGGSAGGMTANQAATQARQAQQDAFDQRRWQEGYDVDKAKFNATLGENQRQYNETFGFEKAKFNAQHGLAEAQQKWREAVDARDHQAAEFWKNRSYELERNQLTRAATNDLYAAKRGPQDWVSYWYRSRGMTPPAGVESVPIEQAIPNWARPVEYGQGAPRAVATAQPEAQAPAATVPAWSQPAQQPAAQPAPAAPVFTRDGVTPGASVAMKTVNGTTTVAEPTLAATGVPGAKTGQTFSLAQFGGEEPAWLRAALSGQEAKIPNWAAPK